MLVLIAYASPHGATREVAERIAERCEGGGLHAHAQRVTTVAAAVSCYDAFVIGSATYQGRWQGEATEFIRRNQALLADLPTWLFSSGPLGTDGLRGRAGAASAAIEPQGLSELRALIHPRDHRTFSGALTPRKLGLREHAIRMLPTGHARLPAGDFRDWAEIDGWATGIAEDLTQRAAPSGVR